MSDQNFLCVVVEHFKDFDGEPSVRCLGEYHGDTPHSALQHAAGSMEHDLVSELPGRTLAFSVQEVS